MARNRIQRHIYHAVKRAVALGNRRSAVAQEYGISIESVRKICLSPNWKTWIQPKADALAVTTQEQRLASDLELNERFITRNEFEAAVRDLNERLDVHNFVIQKKADKKQRWWSRR